MPLIPVNEPFNLYVLYNTEQQRETWFDQKDFEPRFTMPMIELLDEYPADDLFHFMSKPTPSYIEDDVG